MANEQINITIREDGSRVVKRNLEDLGDSGKKAADGVDLLKKALAGIAVAELGRQLLELTNTYQTMQNRIRIVTASTAELNVVNEELLRISNETRQSYEGTVETYSRVALSAKSLGVSQQDLLTFTENLNKAIAVSGVNAQTATNGMIQLSQGMASGRLQGQDLRAVLEDIPAVGDVIAEHFGTTRGALRKMGEEGKITAKDIIAAFTEGGNEIGAKFDKTIPTIGQAFTVLKNNVLATVGAFAQNSGVADALAKALLLIANHVEELGRIFLAVAIIIGVNFAVQAVGAAIEALAALGAAALANPFTAIAEVLLVVISLLTVFSDKIDVGGGHIANLRDLAVAAWNDIKAGFQGVVDFFKDHFGSIVDAGEKAFGQLDLSVAGFLHFVADIIDAQIGLWLGLYRAIIAAFSGLPTALGDIFKTALNGVLDMVQTFINGIIGAVNAVASLTHLGTIDEVQIKRAQTSGQNLGQSVGQAFKSGLEFSGAHDAVDALLGDADKIAAQRKKNEAQKAAEDAAARAGLTAHGPAAPLPIDDKDAKKRAAELQKVRNEMISLLGTVDPVRASLLQMAKDQDILTKATKLGVISLDDQKKYMAALKEQADKDILGPILDKADPTRAAMTELTEVERRLSDARKAGLVTADQEATYLARLKKAYEESVDPLKHLTDELNAQIKIAGESSRQREIDTQLRQHILDLQQKGVYLTQAETAALRAQLEVLQKTNELQGIKDQILGQTVEKRRTEGLTAQATGELLKDGKITKDDAFNQANSATGGLFDGTQQAIDAQMQAYQDMYRQIDEYRQADVISEQTASQAKARIDVQMNQLRLANYQTFFGTLASLSHSKNKELAAIGKAAAATQATIDGYLAVQKALASYPPPVNFAMAAAVGVVAAANVASILSSNTNFATGGSFVVPGTGGTDSVLVGLRASPGERVSVQTPTQVRHGTTAANGESGSAGGAGAQVNQRIINVLDPSMVGEFLSTAEGEEVLINVMRRNGDQVKSIVGGSN
jgi:tape measure domain-containing protein